MNKELYGLTENNLMRTLPEVLEQDEGMNPLGRMIARSLANLLSSIKHTRIYARIDQLGETALDALAKDFDVGWYDYNYSLATKRALIKDSFFVHRHLGTKGALDKALSDIFPNSTALEWFEYGGRPYYFQVVLDVTNTREPAYIGIIKKAIEYYKSFRSHLEDDAVVARISCGIVIRTGQDGIGYAVPKAGTIPAVSTQGGVEDKNILVESRARNTPYAVPKTGYSKAGTAPAVSTQGGIDTGSLTAVATASGGLYHTPKCGTSSNSLN